MQFLPLCAGHTPLVLRFGILVSHVTKTLTLEYLLSYDNAPFWWLCFATNFFEVSFDIP